VKKEGGGGRRGKEGKGEEDDACPFLLSIFSVASDGAGGGEELEGRGAKRRGKKKKRGETPRARLGLSPSSWKRREKKKKEERRRTSGRDLPRNQVVRGVSPSCRWNEGGEKKVLGGEGKGKGKKRDRTRRCSCLDALLATSSKKKMKEKDGHAGHEG